MRNRCTSPRWAAARRGTVEAEVVRFADLRRWRRRARIAGRQDRLHRLPDDPRAMAAATARRRVRSEGSVGRDPQAGALAFLMRSAGTDNAPRPHTGITRFDDGLTPIPSASLSHAGCRPAGPPASRWARCAIALDLDCGWDGEYTSQNVIGEITGRSLPDEVVVIGGHLDSWDLGTGAIDDGAGVGITMAAGHLIGQLPKAAPARTIRVIAFANEEQGLHGGAPTRQKHAADIAQAPARRGKRLRRRPHLCLRGEDARLRERGRCTDRAGAGAARHRVRTRRRRRLRSRPVAVQRDRHGLRRLSQDGTDYFDLHHTPDDTLDKIDPKALAQNVAAYTVFAYPGRRCAGRFRQRAEAGHALTTRMAPVAMRNRHRPIPDAARLTR
jgi:hypothetical protein